MNEISFPYWADDYKMTIKALKCVTQNINEYLLIRSDSSFQSMMNSVIIALNYWSGNTYVGEPKEPIIKDAFQKFFLALRKMLLEFRMNPQSMPEIKIGEIALYRGMVYRYLGHRSSTEKEPIIPQYNDIYVSWSKEPKNSYLESKLYRPMTWMACEIKEPHWGIDLEGLGVSRGDEREVVFPTLEDCISEIKYIPEVDEDGQT